MLNTLLFIHIVVALMLVAVILLQKTSADGLSSIGGGSNMGLVSGRSAANFLTKTTVILATIFFVNAIVLGNISSNTKTSLSKRLEQRLNEEKQQESTEESSLPIAK